MDNKDPKRLDDFGYNPVGQNVDAGDVISRVRMKDRLAVFEHAATNAAKLSGLYKTRDGEDAEAYVSPDEKLVILSSEGSVSVISDESVVNKFVHLAVARNLPDRWSGDALEEVPAGGIAGVSAAIGGIATTAYLFNEIVLSEPNDGLRFLMFFLGAFVYLPGGVVGAGVSAGASWILAKGAALGVDIAGALGSPSRRHEVKRIQKELDEGLGTAEEIVIDAPHVLRGFGKVVLNMLLLDKNPKEFWDEYALPAVNNVTTYDDNIEAGQESGTSDDERMDADILKFQGLAVISTLVDVHEKRNNSRRKAD